MKRRSRTLGEMFPKATKKWPRTSALAILCFAAAVTIGMLAGSVLLFDAKGPLYVCAFCFACLFVDGIAADIRDQEVELITKVVTPPTLISPPVPPPTTRAVIAVEAQDEDDGRMRIDRIVFNDGVEYRRVGKFLVRYPEAEFDTRSHELEITSLAVRFVIKKRWLEEDRRREEWKGYEEVK